MAKVSVIVPVYNVENYIRDMLISVQNQTFKDFEVILINDGSPDNSQVIIEEFCRADKRFKCYVQENGGVAAARNNGIMKAQGDYLVFYDPDDFIPKDALKSMYKAAKKNNADLVIGVMRESSIGERRYNASTVNLSKKSRIDKFDKDLLWSFSVCNKMFRREFIKNRNIVFPSIKHAEDAVFLFNAIFKSDIITGCSKCVYEYKTRNFWEEKSATQTVTYEYLRDVISALDSIEELIIENSRDKSNDFLEEFYARYLDISLFVRYYRAFWNLDEMSKILLEKKVYDIKCKISSNAWNQVLLKNIDLQLEKNAFSNQKLLNNSLLTIIVDENISEERAILIINNIYNQSMPFFKVLLSKKHKTIIAENNLLKENMFFTEIIDIDNIDTEFVMFADERILFSKNSARTMVRLMLKDANLDFATAPIKCYLNNNLFDTLQVSAFTVLQCVRGCATKYNKCDFLMGNKIFRKSSISNYKAPIKYFDYGSMRYKKVYNTYMISLEDLSKDFNNVNSLPCSLRIKYKCKQKAIEEKIVDIIKKYFTKDDLRKVIKRL